MTIQIFLIAEFALGLLAGVLVGATKVEKALLSAWHQASQPARVPDAPDSSSAMQ